MKSLKQDVKVNAACKKLATIEKKEVLGYCYQILILIVLSLYFLSIRFPFSYFAYLIVNTILANKNSIKIENNCFRVSSQ